MYDCFCGSEWGSPEKWYERYILGIKDDPSPELIFGSMVDKKIQADPTFLPELERFPAMQYKMFATWNKIKMIGYADGWHRAELKLKDDKTGRAQWTQAKADSSGQFTFYLAMMYIQEQVEPGVVKIFVDWMETEKTKAGKIRFVKDMKVKRFITKRTRVQVLDFLGEIEKVVMQMQDYVRKHD